MTGVQSCQPEADGLRQHTPTPWSVCNDGKCSCLTISCPDYPIAKVTSGEWGDEYPAMRQVGASPENRYEAYMERIGYGSIDPEIARANALLIVEAVNSHATLQARVDELTKALTVIAEDSYLDEYQMEFRPTSAALTARAALSLERSGGAT